MRQSIVSKYLHKFIPLLYISFFISLFCGFRVVSSIGVGALFLLSLLLNRLQEGRFFTRPIRSYFVGACLVFYLLQVLALAYTHNLSSGLGHIQIKITLVLIPIALYYGNYLNVSFREKIMPFYVLFMALSMLFCLCAAGIRYSYSKDSSVFFYYALVQPFDQHAIQYSILAYIGLVYLLERWRRQSFFLNRPFHFFTISYFIFTIILLSSKMVISFSFISILLYAGLSIKKSGSRWWVFILSAVLGISVLITLVTTHNPVSKRFRDIFSGNISVIEQNQFKPGDYFNGVQFRLLQWKLVTEILNEHKAWITGVSPGDARQLLNRKYRSMNMYLGDPARGDSGFLDYNTHNEFLESTLQTGAVGLIVFLLICTGCVRMMLRSNSIEFWLIGTLLIFYCFVESVFETQYGVLLFTFFPLFLFYTSDGVSGRKSSISFS